MEKHIRQSGYIPELNGMKAVNLVRGSVTDFEKDAADFSYKYSDDMLEAIEKFKKDIKPTEILATVIGLGAGEFYSSNVNGDYFTEETLLRIFKTFEDGVLFQHHVNRDPALSLGSIKFATYNTKMHRNELLIAPDRSRAENWVAAIERGDVVDVSFGYRTPWDRCSICSNRAGSRDEYCIHLKNQMNQILPDGRKVYAINPDIGRFFELSFVSKGAVPIAKVMQKVAARGYDSEFMGLSVIDEPNVEVVESEEPKHNKLAEMKLAELIKDVENNMVHSGVDPIMLKFVSDFGMPFSEKYERNLDPHLFKNYKLDDILGTLPITGIVPKLTELVQILSLKVDELSNFVDKLKSNNYNYKEDDEVDHNDLYSDDLRFRFNKSLFDVLGNNGFIRDRSWFLGPLFNRMLEIDSRGPEEYVDRLEKTSFDIGDKNLPGAVAVGAAGYIYSKYLQNIAPSKLSNLERIAAQYPALLPAIILGITLTANSMRSVGEDITPNYFINNEMVTPDRIVKQSSTEDGFKKISAIMKNVIVPFGVGQLGSAYWKVKRDAQGKELSSPFNFWANHPFLSSLLLMGGSHLLKKGEVEKDAILSDALAKAILPLSYKSSELMGMQLGGLAVDSFILSKMYKLLSGDKKSDVKQFKNQGYRDMNVMLSGGLDKGGLK